MKECMHRYLIMKYLFTCSGSAKINVSAKKSRKSTGALQKHTSELEIPDESTIESNGVSDSRDSGDGSKKKKVKKNKINPSSSNTRKEQNVERNHESTFSVNEASRKTHQNKARRNKNSLSAKKNKVKTEHEASPALGTSCDIPPEKGDRGGKIEVKNRDATPAEHQDFSGLRHPKDPVHSPDNEDENIVNEQQTTPKPVTDKPKTEEGIGKLPKTQTSSSGRKKMDASVHVDDKLVPEMAQNSSENKKKDDSYEYSTQKSNDATRRDADADGGKEKEDSKLSTIGKENIAGVFDDAKSPEKEPVLKSFKSPNPNGKDINAAEIDYQSSLPPDADVEKKGVSKSLKSTNGKESVAPENDALDPVLPQAGAEKKGVSKSLKSTNGKESVAPENDALDPVLPVTTRGRKTDCDKDGAFTSEKSENGDGPVGENDDLFGDTSLSDSLLVTADGDATNLVTDPTITPENVANGSKGKVDSLSSSDTSSAINKIIEGLSSGDEDKGDQSLSDSIYSKMKSVSSGKKTPDSMEFYRLKKQYSGNFDSSTQGSATAGSSEEDGTVSEKTKRDTK